jgi:hypothetical protein
MSGNPYSSDPWQGHDLATFVRPVDHESALRTTTALTETHRRMYNRDATPIEPEDIIRLFNREDIKFVLMGAHGIGGWIEAPRATRDVDLLIYKRHHRKAVRTVQQQWPMLVKQEHEVVTRFLDPADQKSSIDLMRPIDLFVEAFKNCIEVGDTHRVPNLEMALACKFAALISRTRSEDKKHLDASDFIQMVRRNYDSIDRARLQRLGEAVYPGGGEEVARMIEDVKAGRPLRV